MQCFYQVTRLGLLEEDAVVLPLNIFTSVMVIYVQITVIKSYGTLYHLVLDVGIKVLFGLISDTKYN